ncbi:hypothetical protein RhiirA4_481651 [Rhizophagus irregularis]|uniref:Uncharacterized protein n=1 Tax=Rhizophagus irregularis TaxID=588596 RepID=A0A2I1HJS9_9GLOM|nr:hypothetical protein RhiirA4_481651 [Rhizophagus irregularis]
MLSKRSFIKLYSLIGLQSRYNLLNRSLEFVLQPACAELDVGIIPWVSLPKVFWKIYERISRCIKTSISRSISYVQKLKNWKILDEDTAISKEIAVVELLLKLTLEQMKRLDEISKPTEIPFPYSYVCIFSEHLGKNIEVPKNLNLLRVHTILEDYNN